MIDLIQDIRSAEQKLKNQEPLSKKEQRELLQLIQFYYRGVLPQKWEAIDYQESKFLITQCETQENQSYFLSKINQFEQKYAAVLEAFNCSR